MSEKQQQPETYTAINENHKVVWQRDLGVVGYFTKTLLQIYCWVCFESIF